MVPVGEPTRVRADSTDEQRRRRRYPISRWYLCPLAGWLAAALAPTCVRPVHLTACGLISAASAAGVLLWRPEAAPAAAVAVLAAWFFDRADGQLARRQGTVSAWGAWLDANVDELVDVGLHLAVAAAAASQTASSWPWALLIAFASGKYLLMYGLNVEQHLAEQVAEPTAAHSLDQSGTLHPPPAIGWLHRAYHLPANADLRVHLLAAALLTGWLTAELAMVAVYYNLRWIARYLLVARRLPGGTR